MPNLNKVMLMGNLTRDPELRYLPNNNTAVVNIGLAINRRWRNQQGEPQEETTFVDCEAFGRTAEVINEHLRKGRPIFIEGRLKLDQWQDKEGNNRSKMRVVIESFEFVDSRAGGGGDEGGGGGSARPAYQQRAPRAPGNSGPGSPGGGSGNRSNREAPPSGDPHQAVQEDDIPF